MKTIKLLTLAAVASFALGAPVFADHQPGHPTKMTRTAPSSPDSPRSARTWDYQPVLLRTVGYPVVFLGRAGHSVIRSPQIVAETISGDRKFISKRGLFANTKE